MLCLPWVKCCRLHALCIYKVAISTSSDKQEASIPAFSAAKEGDVASLPSPLVNTSRSANRFLFAVGKVLLFAFPLHMPSCNERFQERAGIINRFVFICKRGRRFFVPLSAWRQLKICKQVFWLPSVKCSHRIPSAYIELQ